MKCKYQEECKYFKERELHQAKYLFVFSCDYTPYLNYIYKFIQSEGISIKDVELSTVKCNYSAWELNQYLPVLQVNKCRSFFTDLPKYKAILAFGPQSTKLFTRVGNMYNYMEYPVYYENIPVYTTFSIYEIAHNNLKMQIAAYTLSKLNYIPKKPKYKVMVNDIENCIKDIQKSKILVYDFETNGLLPVFYKGEGKITTLAVSANTKRVYVFDDINIMKQLKPYFEDENIIKIAHNIQYDAQVLEIGLGIKARNPLVDTMLMAYLLNEKQALTLKALSPSVGIYYSEEEERQFKDNIELSKDAFYKYNAKDVMATQLLYIKYIKELIEEDLYSVFANILSPLQYVLIQIQKNGMRVDTNILQDLTKKYQQRISELEISMKLLPKVKQYEQDNGPLNINSTQQLITLLTKYYNINLKATTKKGSLKLDKEVLLSLKDSKANDFIELLLEYKLKQKLLSTYLKSFITKGYIGKDNAIHSNFMISTGTGRLSSNSPNLQNIAGNKDIKSMFIARDNHILVNADYSSCELRVSAGISNETSMIKAFSEGLDLHAKVGHEVFGEPEHVYKEDKKKRTMVKAINFGLLYGMGSYTLAKRIGVKEKEAAQYIEDYYRTYKNIQATIHKYQSITMNNGYVRLPFGKRRYLLDIANKDADIRPTTIYLKTVKKLLQKKRESAERETYNTVVQGTSVFFTYLSLIRIQNYIERNNIDAYIVNTVHDSIVISVNKKEALDLIHKIQYYMMNYNYAWLNGVPLRGDVEVGYDYGHLKEVEPEVLEDRDKFMEFIENI